jgi:hypothetical protein
MLAGQRLDGREVLPRSATRKAAEPSRRVPAADGLTAPFSSQAIRAVHGLAPWHPAEAISPE